MTTAHDGDGLHEGDRDRMAHILAKRGMSEQEVWAEFRDYPQPEYPFPDITPDYLQRLREVYYTWIDEDWTFHTNEARAKHKLHRLVDLSARALPYLTFEEQLPICRYSATGAMLDDYYDHASTNEMQKVWERVNALVTGEDPDEPAPSELGIFHQWWLMRQDAIKCGIPMRIYDQFASEVQRLVHSYVAEKPYKVADTPPPLPVYDMIREISSGALAFCKYVAVQKDYRRLPDHVLDHWHILRMHQLTGLLVGYHNDILSFPREVTRVGDVINIVLVLSHEYNLPLEAAYLEAMRLHDQALQEFITLQENLPDFGEWTDLARSYAHDLGTNIQGIWSWHTKSSLRYVPGSYVEPEYVSSELNW